MLAVGIAIGIEIAVGSSGTLELVYEAWTDEAGNPMTDEAGVDIDFISL